MSDIDHTPTAATVAEAGGPTTREAVVAKEKQEFGGFAFGSAFFGWLTATGTLVILAAIVATLGSALGVDASLALGGAIAAVVLLIAYYCGGYVAGRMARFSGVKQGIAVWLWAIVVALVLAVVGFIAGTRTDLMSNLNDIPITEGELTTGSILGGVIALIVSLIGAVLGGLAGMRFHRRVDRAGLGR
jgi:hypothetical protein